MLVSKDTEIENGKKRLKELQEQHGLRASALDAMFDAQGRTREIEMLLQRELQKLEEGSRKLTKAKTFSKVLYMTT